MAEAIMCSGVKYTSVCPHKEGCYRYTVDLTPSPENIFLTAPFEISFIRDIPVVTCNMFYSNGN